MGQLGLGIVIVINASKLRTSENFKKRRPNSVDLKKTNVYYRVVEGFG